MQPATTTRSWETALEGWVSMYRSALPALRAAYLVELERFAETLRPRFEAGELRGFAAADGEDGVASPRFELEELCCAHFRLTELDDAALALLMQLTPRLRATAGTGDGDHAAHLQSAIAWDVIAVARARRWYEPCATEERDPLAMKRCSRCHHLDEAHRPACRVLDCACQGGGAATSPGPFR